METAKEFIKWWGDWYTQETKLVMPKIAEQKMFEQLDLLQAKLKESASQQEQGYTKEILWQFFVRGNDHDYTDNSDDIRLDFENYYNAWVKGDIKTIPPSQQTTKESNLSVVLHKFMAWYSGDYPIENDKTIQKYLTEQTTKEK
jgi:hypothetical protein